MENKKFFTGDDFFQEQAAKAGLFLKEDLSKMNIPQEIIEKIPNHLATTFKVVPFKIEEDILKVATYNVDILKSPVALKNHLDIDIIIVNAERDNVNNALKKYYGSAVSRKIEEDTVVSDEDSPMVQMIMKMLQHAAELKASDIHMFPTSVGMKIMFRINGHLKDFSSEYVIGADELENFTNVVKGRDRSGQADSNKKTMPNNGSFHFTRGNILIDVRMATVPVGNKIGLQKINLRLLPQTSKRVSLDELGYEEKDLNTIKITIFRNASGLFINSGPTGAGKTTTLYAELYCLRDARNEPLNIMTIDNPIEIREEDFTQVQVREADVEGNNLSAQKILKVGLRSDPDVFLYNEIRDAEDAAVAIEASSTGHPVFTTVHASDVPRTILRLLDLNISKVSFLAELKMISSQRLVEFLCPSCSRPHKLTDLEKMVLDNEELTWLSSNFGPAQFKEKGHNKDCPNCKGTGTIGRRVIAEIVVLDNELRDALMDIKNFTEIKELLKKHGFMSMWGKALCKAYTGEIELNEVIQVIGKE